MISDRLSYFDDIRMGCRIHYYGLAFDFGKYFARNAIDISLSRYLWWQWYGFSYSALMPMKPWWVYLSGPGAARLATFWLWHSHEFSGFCLRLPDQFIFLPHSLISACVSRIFILIHFLYGLYIIQIGDCRVILLYSRLLPVYLRFYRHASYLSYFRFLTFLVLRYLSFIMFLWFIWWYIIFVSFPLCSLAGFRVSWLPHVWTSLRMHLLIYLWPSHILYTCEHLRELARHFI